MPVIDAPLYVLAGLFALVLAAEWLARNTAARHLGAALLVILLAALAANLGLLPAGDGMQPVYNGVFAYAAPLSIFFLMLEVNLRELRSAGLPMLIMFLLGSAGTLLGVLIALNVTGLETLVGGLAAPLGGMFAATYTGGSLNFNTLALHYGIVEEGGLYAGAVAVDNLMTSVWMIATLILPKILHGVLPRRKVVMEQFADEREALRHHEDTETVSPMDLALLLALGLVVTWLSNLAAAELSALGVEVPSLLILTTGALLLAQIPALGRLTGSRVLGMLAVYLFLAVIGAHADVSALADLGQLGLVLFAFVAILMAVHGAVLFGAGSLLRHDWDLMAVASQANIGGGTSALALAKSLGRGDLFLPAILVGSLGTGLGTYLGFIVARLVEG
jgi:uncharacterized membrane protein